MKRLLLLLLCGVILFGAEVPVLAYETGLTASRAKLIDRAAPINMQYKIGTRLYELETGRPSIYAGGTPVASAGLLGGAGTSTSASQTLGAGGSNVKGFSYYLSTTSVTATHVQTGYYLNMNYGTSGASAAPSGDAIRGRAWLIGDASGSSAVTGGAFSAELAATTASNTGLTAGLRGNIVLPDGVMTNSGTYYGTMAEVFLGGAAQNTTAYTSIAPLGVVIGGTSPTATSQLANMVAIAFVVPSNMVGAGELFVGNSNLADLCEAKLRVTVNGVTYWIMLSNNDD